jgi:hypothetical protein
MFRSAVVQLGRAEVTDKDEFKTFMGCVDLAYHPLASMWIFLSRFRAEDAWESALLVGSSDLL